MKKYIITEEQLRMIAEQPTKFDPSLLTTKNGFLSYGGNLYEISVLGTPKKYHKIKYDGNNLIMQTIDQSKEGKQNIFSKEENEDLINDVISGLISGKDTISLKFGTIKMKKIQSMAKI